MTITICFDRLDATEITTMLDACLLTDDEMSLGPDGWLRELHDPLPTWEVLVVDEEDHEGGNSY